MGNVVWVMSSQGRPNEVKWSYALSMAAMSDDVKRYSHFSAVSSAPIAPRELRPRLRLTLADQHLAVPVARHLDPLGEACRQLLVHALDVGGIVGGPPRQVGLVVGVERLLPRSA